MDKVKEKLWFLIGVAIVMGLFTIQSLLILLKIFKASEMGLRPVIGNEVLELLFLGFLIITLAHCARNLKKMNEGLKIIMEKMDWKDVLRRLAADANYECERSISAQKDKLPAWVMLEKSVGEDDSVYAGRLGEQRIFHVKKIERTTREAIRSYWAVSDLLKTYGHKVPKHWKGSLPE